RAAGLTRAAHALRLVPPPVLWLVMERATEAPDTARLLRGTGVSYRHLTYPENFTADGVGTEKERHHQRNVALGHVEEHRLDGVVLFAGLGDVYDLRFFDQLRQIRCMHCPALQGYKATRLQVWLPCSFHLSIDPLVNW
uniref:Glycosyltransferases n=2 Tax=Aegilops tauschii subsp. strangulata TaxID=200361 RepID=A0A453AJ46_AEGTS